MRRVSAPVLASAIVLSLVFALGMRSADAQTGLTVTDGGVENRFPDGMTFWVEAQSDSPIEDIRLRYEILPDGTSANGVPDFEPSENVTAQFDLSQTDNPLPPGTVVEYYWEVTDADGDVAETDRVSFYYTDIRFEWVELKDDGVTIHYYSGSDDDAAEMHDVAVDTLGDVSGLLGTEIPFEVHVWIYASPDDMRPALQRLSASRDAGVITAGVRVATDTVLVLGEGSFDTLRHELTHVVTAEAGEGIFRLLPFWLDEGTAVYFQEDRGGFRDAAERAIERGQVFSIRQITTIAGEPEDIGLYYGQSWHIVEYMIDTYGEEQFANLYAEMHDGKRIDGALEAVYGFDQDGLEDEWRAANDLPPRVTAAPGDSDPPPESVEAEDDNAGTSTGTILLLGAAILLLAAVVGFAGITVARRL